MNDKKVVAIMQPYLFPYIGYWQLINAVDEFILLDDVNFIKRGYINRNTILINGNIHRFTIPVHNVSQNSKIKDMRFALDDDVRCRFLRMIYEAYYKCKCFDEVYMIIEEIIYYEDSDITAYIKNSIEKILSYLNIRKNILLSSQIEKDNNAKGQDRIMEICKGRAANIYINPGGAGRMLYDRNFFSYNGIKLYFLNAHIDEIKYIQGKDHSDNSYTFVPSLSIIDILMNNEVEIILDFLGRYSLDE